MHDGLILTNTEEAFILASLKHCLKLCGSVSQVSFLPRSPVHPYFLQHAPQDINDGNHPGQPMRKKGQSQQICDIAHV
jgi:hypothetical protein